MKIIKYPLKSDWELLLTRPVFDSTILEGIVQSILFDIKKNGDSAVKKYTKEFDKVDLNDLLVSEDEFLEAEKNVSADLKNAIQLAKSNIEKFHLSQKEDFKVVETTIGVICWRKSLAIEKVGLYIPGGSAPLFSTVLMLGIPAVLAGCKEIVLCTPPDGNKKINDVILYTAKLLGIRNVYKVGGVQAIGAMAFGTETISKVHKIFGPGNQYVTCAKQLVNKEGIAIDMPAGPSELAVLADGTCLPEFVAADLLSQAEHGTDSQVILVSTDGNVIDKIIEE